MSVTTVSLRDLHELKQRHSRLREQIERGPRQVAAKQKLLADRNQAAEHAKSELKSFKVKGHEKETERKALDNRIQQLQLQINTAKSNKEYSTLVSERDTVIKARSAVEDQVLDMLVREEEKNREIEKLDAELKRIEKELAELEQITAQQTGELTAKLNDTEARLRAAEAALPADVKDVYRRLVGRRGDDALAESSNATCTGCYTAITPQMQNQLMLNELVVCKSCGRILYLSAAPEPV